MVNDDAITFVILIASTAAIVGWVSYSNANKIPRIDKVQEGYVVPNKLEIELDDMDRSGEKEVIVKYDGKPYLFRLDEQGKPVIVPYEIRPSGDYFKFEVKPLEEE